MTRRTMLALALTIGAFSSPVEAIEMFTNFNNGTELGTRPLGIEIMSPVRYHAYPQGRWFRGPMPGCGNSGSFETAPASPPSANRGDPATQISQLRGDRPVEIRPQAIEPTLRRAAPESEDDWIRSTNFLPPTQGN